MPGAAKNVAASRGTGSAGESISGDWIRNPYEWGDILAGSIRNFHTTVIGILGNAATGAPAVVPSGSMGQLRSRSRRIAPNANHADFWNPRIEPANDQKAGDHFADGFPKWEAARDLESGVPAPFGPSDAPQGAGGPRSRTHADRARTAIACSSASRTAQQIRTSLGQLRQGFGGFLGLGRGSQTIDWISRHPAAFLPFEPYVFEAKLTTVTGREWN